MRSADDTAAAAVVAAAAAVAAAVAARVSVLVSLCQQQLIVSALSVLLSTQTQLSDFLSVHPIDVGIAP